MSTPDVTAAFRALHRPGEPLLMPNPWDVGSARILTALGFSALATTSSGFAATLGRFDGGVTRDEALAHSAALVAATPLPVSADLEDGFGPDPATVAETVSGALAAGLAGCSIEDFTGVAERPIHERRAAVERIAAAAQAAHAGPRTLVLTARCENFLRGNTDLTDTIERLQAYQEAGADVLFAPGVKAIGDVATLVAAVDRPVNVLLLPGGPGPGRLAEVGVARISVGGMFAWAAASALVDAARDLQAGSTAYFDRVASGRAVIAEAFE